MKFHMNYRSFFDLNAEPRGSLLKTSVDIDFLHLAIFLRDRFKMPDPTALAVTNCLFARMSDARLHYHTPVHVLSMLQTLYENRDDLKDFNEGMELAIWFHDAIYLPGAKHGLSEELSAAFMKTLLDPYVDDKTMSWADNAVTITAQYESPTIGNHRYETMMDLDLCSLSWDWENYKAAGDCIEKEFVPLVCTKEQFMKGRLGFLQSLLSRKSIYRSDFFREKFEKKARENLNRSLEEILSYLVPNDIT